MRILLVEDNAVISALLTEILAGFGHDVCGIVVTEIDAVVAAARHAPDLMIVDIVLLAGDGVSAMATILRTSVMPHIFMTAGSRQRIPATAAVLYKPFGMAALVAALDSVAWRFEDQA